MRRHFWRPSAVIEFFTWAQSAEVQDRPWCVLGKGPTFAKRASFPLDRYRLLGLNHVVSEQQVFLGHAADLDVIEACGDAIEANCEWFLMPLHPHVDFVPAVKSLVDLLDDFPVLRRLEDKGRLLYYNLSTAGDVPGEPVVETAKFSGVVAVRLLAQAGVRSIRSLGIDGGRGYSGEFSGLEATTMLSNGEQSFDHQLAEIESVAEWHGVDYAPLFPPLRIFVGTDETQTVAAQVLAHTIRQHTKLPVDIRPLLNVEVPLPRAFENRPRTGFSFSRFVIPAACGFEGRALYLDADMQVFGDVSDLWDLDFNGHSILCTSQTAVPSGHPGYEHFRVGRQFSVMLLDCSRLDWDVREIVGCLDRGEFSYEELMFDMCILPPDDVADLIPASWNHLERYEPGVTALIHYTLVDTQPWKNDRNPLASLWTTAYEKAVACGAVNVQEVRRNVASQVLKPSLLGALSSAPSPEPPLMSGDRSFEWLRSHVPEGVMGLLRRARRRIASTSKFLRTG